MNSKWQKSEANSNVILRGDNFYISFNPTPVKAQHSETALVDSRNLPDRPMYLLMGDHRTAYEEIIDLGFEACFGYYQTQLQVQN